MTNTSAPSHSERPLTERIAAARGNGQVQFALDLARKLIKQEPTEEHRELLRQVTLQRAQELQASGKTADAAALLRGLVAMGGTVEFQGIVSQGLVACGGIAPTGAVTDDETARQGILAQRIDAALARGAKSKSELSAELHAGFDAILQAFAHAEAGRDEEARACLQTIGLQSPFLEWKLLLRGLIAYYAKDDQRAIENWQRLDAKRLPARIVAPLRAGIDPPFLRSQPQAAQKALRAKFETLHGGSFVGPLRELQRALPREELASAFRKAEHLVPVMNREYHHLVRRLEQCFFWAIIDHGEPNDVPRYLRAFGPPPDDPKLIRLQALAVESRGYFDEAHEFWQHFINHVAASPKAWPGEVGTMAQAIIWARMAENAGALRQRRRRRGGNPFFDMFADDDIVPIKPTAEQCLAKAIKLAPERLDSYLALFNLHRENGHGAKAIKVGQQLLKRFPEHADTLEAMGELSLEQKDFQKAQDYLERSLRANPLDRTLRGKLGRARQNLGLALTIAKSYDQARVQYEQALQLWEGPKTPLLCQWACAELKADNAPRAEALIAQANAEPNQRLACRYALVGESVRAKLATHVKKRFAAELKAALAEPSTPAEVLVLLECAAHQRRTHADSFHGQKTQEKAILKFLDDLSYASFDEQQLERLCAGLTALQARKPWLKCLNHARRQYPNNVAVRLSFVDYYLTERRAEQKTHLARTHLDAARRLVEQLPRGEQQQQYLEQIKVQEEVIAKLHAGAAPMFGMLNEIFGGFDDDDEDYF